MIVDFDLYDHGSLCVLIPMTRAAARWLSDNIGEDATTWGGGVVIEPRYVDDILLGIDDDGLTVK